MISIFSKVTKVLRYKDAKVLYSHKKSQPGITQIFTNYKTQSSQSFVLNQLCELCVFQTQ
ncbi:hypothetical protein B0A81_16555 [Flavobacterium plurextorum]|uniref:Uncharacterized protein n=1 Tax=Flavobacterium plurextorum TaxID=1114867 RepID=A0ABX4CQX1_9FLAO|nr:hypothetical protein B0A81_16555 [Flavobacterium plurextorum]